MPFTIGKANGSTASLSIDVVWYIMAHTVYEYSDGSTETGNFTEDMIDSFSFFREAIIGYSDLLGKQLYIYSDSNDDRNSLIVWYAYASSTSTMDLPKEGQTITMNGYIYRRDYNTNDTQNQLTITITDTGDNYQVTITPSPQYT